MTLRNPNADEIIKDYDELQTAEINNNNDTIMTEIGTIKQSILTILSKLNLISDWVIGSGSNPDGNWEKWASGKLVQRGIKTVDVTLSTVMGVGYRAPSTTVIDFPIEFINSNIVVSGVSCDDWCFVSPTGYDKNLIGVQLVGVAQRTVKRINWEVVGRWKV